MNKYENGVPFDPGYSPYYVDFYTSVLPFMEQLSKIKAVHQKKFKLNVIKPELMVLLKKSTGFYLGCLLWAAYISNRFKDSPKPILRNHVMEDENNSAEESNIREYLNSKIEFIKKIDKDYRYFLKKPLLDNNKILDILETYIEFASVNNYFLNTKSTSDVKLPEKLSYFTAFTLEELDFIEQKIYEIIDSGKLELLLDTNFYKY